MHADFLTCAPLARTHSHTPANCPNEGSSALDVVRKRLSVLQIRSGYFPGRYLTVTFYTPHSTREAQRLHTDDGIAAPPPSYMYTGAPLRQPDSELIRHQLKTWTTTLKTDLGPLSGYARWRIVWVKISSELA